MVVCETITKALAASTLACAVDPSGDEMLLLIGKLAIDPTRTIFLARKPCHRSLSLTKRLMQVEWILVPNFEIPGDCRDSALIILPDHFSTGEAGPARL